MADTNFIADATNQAAEALEPALTTLLDLAGDSQQTGAARVSACKVLLDYGLKLDAYNQDLERHAESSAKLDEMLGYWRHLSGEDEDEID